MPVAFGELAAASAATENDQQSDNDQPDPVIVKQIAQTVIHTKILLKDWGVCPTLP